MRIAFVYYIYFTYTGIGNGGQGEPGGQDGGGGDECGVNKVSSAGRRSVSGRLVGAAAAAGRVFFFETRIGSVGDGHGGLDRLDGVDDCSEDGVSSTGRRSGSGRLAGAAGAAGRELLVDACAGE